MAGVSVHVAGIYCSSGAIIVIGLPLCQHAHMIKPSAGTDLGVKWVHAYLCVFFLVVLCNVK